ncbi:CBS domain-containing protein [Methylocystis parvus]|uniref:CBS domain-containing protein n=1 Tax=Methylocystis parvus TaxID=134 RepID=UPI003C765DF8
MLGLHDLRVADAMIPRADIIAAPLDAPLREALAVFRDAGHSRLPVYLETLDDPRGMVHIRDFVDHLAVCATCATRRRPAPKPRDGASTSTRRSRTPIF